MIVPKQMPDCWNAHGSDTIAEPIMAFQMLKTMTKVPSVPGYSSSEVYEELVNSKFKLTSIL